MPANTAPWQSHGIPLDNMALACNVDKQLTGGGLDPKNLPQSMFEQGQQASSRSMRAVQLLKRQGSLHALHVTVRGGVQVCGVHSAQDNKRQHPAWVLCFIAAAHPFVMCPSCLQTQGI